MCLTPRRETIEKDEERERTLCWGYISDTLGTFLSRSTVPTDNIHSTIRQHVQVAHYLRTGGIRLRRIVLGIRWIRWIRLWWIRLWRIRFGPWNRSCTSLFVCSRLPCPRRHQLCKHVQGRVGSYGDQSRGCGACGDQSRLRGTDDRESSLRRTRYNLCSSSRGSSHQL